MRSGTPRHAGCFAAGLALTWLFGAAASAQGPKSTGANLNGQWYDLNWVMSMDGSGYFSPVAVLFPPGAWVTPPSGQSWLSFTYDGGHNRAGHSYRMQQTFDLTGLATPTTSITFQCAIDNSFFGVYLNGNLTASTCGVFNYGAVETISGGFLNGLNTIEIAYSGDGITDGMAFDVLSTDLQRTVPEPASVLMFGTGLVGMMVVARWRKR